MTCELVKVLRRRELIRNLVARQLKIRYKSSFLGFVWSMLNPLLMMMVYWFIFSRIFTPADVPNFKAYLLCGLFPWYFFSGSLSDSTGSIVGNVSLVKRIYFPRVILPLSTVLTNLVNFFLSLVVLFALLIVWKVPLGPNVAVLPVVIFAEFGLALGLAFFLSSLNVLFRDIEHMLQVILLAWMFMTPAVYLYWRFVPERFWALYFANPMACIIAAYQKILWGYYQGGYSLARLLAVPLGWAAVLVVGGYFFMRRVEGAVVDQL